MASIYSGRRAYIGASEEITYGLAVTPRTNFSALVQASISRVIPRSPKPDLRTSTVSAFRAKHFTEADNVAGAFEMLGNYDNMGIFLKHALGSVADTGVGPYTHTYKVTDELPTGLTLAFGRGTGTEEPFEGCKLNSMTLACATAGIMRATFDIMGETSAARAALVVPTLTVVDCVNHDEFADGTWNGNTFRMLDFSVTLNNGLALRPGLGSLLTKEPKRADFQTCEATITVEVDDALYADFLTDPEGDLVIVATEGTDSFKITVKNAYLSAYTDPIPAETPGLIQATLTFQAQALLVGDSGIVIEVINDSASGIAN